MTILPHWGSQFNQIQYLEGKSFLFASSPQCYEIYKNEFIFSLLQPDSEDSRKQLQFGI